MGVCLNTGIHVKVEDFKCCVTCEWSVRLRININPSQAEVMLDLGPK